MQKICIVICYAIPAPRVHRFFVFNGQNLHHRGYHIHLVSHKDYIYKDVYYKNLYHRPYPAILKEFAKSKVANWAVRNLEYDNALILSTDIDMWIPPSTLDFMESNIDDDTVVFPKPYFIKPAHAWKLNTDFSRIQVCRISGLIKARPIHMMTLNAWYKVRGYDERMTMWGWEDQDFFYRCNKKLNLIFNKNSSSKQFSWAAHMPHNECKYDDNLKDIIRPKYKYRNAYNARFKNWDNPDWGLTIYE